MSASPTPPDFALAKNDEEEDAQAKVHAENGEQVSAADYDPSLDRREDEQKRVIVVEPEMIEEEEEEEDDVDDMFAVATNDPKKKVKKVKRVSVSLSFSFSWPSLLFINLNLFIRNPPPR